MQHKGVEKGNRGPMRGKGGDKGGKGSMRSWGKGKGKAQMMFWVDPTLKVWIGNLAETTKWKELQTHMNQAGKTEWVEVFYGKGKGTGAVVYATADDAVNAVATLNDSELDGSRIIVDTWVRQAKNDLDLEEEPGAEAP